MNSRRNDLTHWNEFRQGSERAFSLLFYRYSDLLLNYGYTLTHDRDLIKDCIQELFLDLWRRKNQLAELEKVNAYLLQAFRRVLFRKIRQDEKQRFFQAGSDAGVILPPEDHLIEAESEHIRNEYIADKLNHLPQRQREIIYLKYYQNLTYEEIGEIMGLQQQAAWNLFSRAIHKLREIMTDHRYILPSLLLVSVTFKAVF
ncbi:MAG: sigma-70 family RNA polymerase sigma factor [Bacteroidia bacterium]